MSLVFEKYTLQKSDGALFEAWNANASASVLPKPITTVSYAVIGCSDARCEEDAVMPKDAYIINNAGSIVETDEIPKGIEHILVVGHEKEEGSGCGACGLAGTVAEKPDYVSENGIPSELGSIGNDCLGHTRDNVIKTVETLNAGNYEAAPFIFNHVTGTLTFLGNKEDYSETMQDLIDQALDQNKLTVLNYNQNTKRGNMKQGQNPYLIAITLGMLPTFSDLTGEGSIFNGPNNVFEVKPGGSIFTTYAQGSAQYPWLHYQSEHNFTNTDATVVTVTNADLLEDVAGKLNTDEAVAQYREKGGAVFGIVVDEKNNKFVESYKLVG